jgi:hypothetical protein
MSEKTSFEDVERIKERLEMNLKKNTELIEALINKIGSGG